MRAILLSYQSQALEAMPVREVTRAAAALSWVSAAQGHKKAAGAQGTGRYYASSKGGN
jgi:hypothetical protein